MGLWMTLIARDAKLNIGRNGFYCIPQSTNNLRTLCQVTEESTTVDSCLRSQNDIEW